MTRTNAIALSASIEGTLVARNHRGMADVREQMTRGYLLRAARLISQCAGRVYILTGFPVGESFETCLLYTSPSPRDLSTSRMPSSA